MSARRFPAVLGPVDVQLLCWTGMENAWVWGFLVCSSSCVLLSVAVFERADTPPRDAPSLTSSSRTYTVFVSGCPCASCLTCTKTIHLGVWFSKEHVFTMFSVFSFREGSLWNILVARDWMVPVCYFDFLAECVSSYKVRKPISYQLGVFKSWLCAHCRI